MTVTATDQGNPAQVSAQRATVSISVTRNIFGPVFAPGIFSVSVEENATVATSIAQLNVNDGDSVVCKLGKIIL